MTAEESGPYEKFSQNVPKVTTAPSARDRCLATAQRIGWQRFESADLGVGMAQHAQ